MIWLLLAWQEMDEDIPPLGELIHVGGYVPQSASAPLKTPGTGGQTVSGGDGVDPAVEQRCLSRGKRSMSRIRTPPGARWMTRAESSRVERQIQRSNPASADVQQ
jgi:hypothetical protein